MSELEPQPDITHGDAVVVDLLSDETNAPHTTTTTPQQQLSEDDKNVVGATTTTLPMNDYENVYDTGISNGTGDMNGYNEAPEHEQEKPRGHYGDEEPDWDKNGINPEGGYRGEEINYSDDGPIDYDSRPEYDLNGDPIQRDIYRALESKALGDEYGNNIDAEEVAYDEYGVPIDTGVAPPGSGYENEEVDGVHDGYEQYDEVEGNDYSHDPYYDNYEYDVDDFDNNEELPGVFVDEEMQSLKGDDELGEKKKKKKRRLILLRRKKKKREEERKMIEEEEDNGRRRRCCWLLLCLLCCLLLLLALLLGILLGKKGDKDNGEDDEVFLDDDFVVDKPYQGITTTPMDPYVEDDCFFDDNVQPHVINQCQCFQSIEHIANDTMQLYQSIRKDINEEIYDGSFDDPITSCDPINQAMYWLSSGDTRDAGDLYQRFIIALTFIKMNGTVWDSQNLWLSDDSECIWFGLQCSSNFKLNNFALDTNNIHGSIPTEISHLDSLRTLSLTRNHLSGSIPKEIITMPHLENLLLYTNNLVGSIPGDISLATNLKTLRLENNLMFGFLTKEIGKATALEELSIGFNQFWRQIPTEMGLLTNMRWLVMEENRFSGTLPTEFGELTNLEYFLISMNLMTGTIPTELARATDLQEFRLASTGIGGIFPSEMSQLGKLHRLEMGANNFEGTIMTEFGLMTGLSWLSMNNNDMTGTLPTELGNIVNMTRMSFKDCMLEGTIPTEFGHMSILENLSLESNSLVGTMPKEVCDLRNLELKLLVVDCSAGDKGVQCEVGKNVNSCCTFCRRQENTVPDFIIAKEKNKNDMNEDGIEDSGYALSNDP